MEIIELSNISEVREKDNIKTKTIKFDNSRKLYLTIIMAIVLFVTFIAAICIGLTPFHPKMFLQKLLQFLVLV